MKSVAQHMQHTWLDVGARASNTPWMPSLYGMSLAMTGAGDTTWHDVR